MATYRGFKEDLITYYRGNESQIPAAPMVEENKVALEDLYVIPPMYAYDTPFQFGPGNRAHIGQTTSNKDSSKRQRATVCQIFLSRDNVRYKKIFITANAGCGKTSLSQKLTMTWCQAHSPLKALKSKYKDEELAAVKFFDLLFLLHLRDYQSEPTCNLDDLIIRMVTARLPRNTLYTKEVLQRLLHEKKCLIIVDGLDEWAHPDKCRRTPAVPHNNYPDSCTVVTTSRPWKLGMINLSEHNIDQHIEICEHDDNTLEELENNIVRILNERRLNFIGKDRTDFNEEVKSVQIGEMIYISYILQQLMCLFFGGFSIGKSKCEIYSNITEFTLKRALNRKNIGIDINVLSNGNTGVPNCMKEKEACTLYISLIMKLGQVAFFTLFGEKKESSLIFHSRLVTKYMTNEEIDFCLKVGLLCQTKCNSIIAVKGFTFYFQHKSVQEFFSAIYITSEWENNTVQSTILNACSSLTSALEMSNLFVFVCGMNHEVYTYISGVIQNLVDLDVIRHRYRSGKYTLYETSVYWDDMRTMKSYQSMQLMCFQECMRNGNESCAIHLPDIVLDDSITDESLTDLNKIILLFNDNMKSLNIKSQHEKIGGFGKNLAPGVSLETLRLEDCDKEPVWLADFLTRCSHTLKCLTLSGPSKGRMSLSDISLTALTGLTCLNSLHIHYTTMTHVSLKCLCAYISQTATLAQLKLNSIDCLDHKNQYRDCDITLDLLHRNEIKLLDLSYIQYRELHVNPAYLEILRLSPQVWTMNARDLASFWESLLGAPALVSLELHDTTSCQQMVQTIPTLMQLRCLKLANIDMGDAILDLPCEMIKLERVELVNVTMSFAAWRKLFLGLGVLPWGTTIILDSITMTLHEWRELLLGVGVLQQYVKVILKWCKGPSIKEWNTIVEMIKSTPSLRIILDLNFRTHGASLSLDTTIRTGLPPEIKRMDEKSIELYKQALAEGSMPDCDVRVMIVGHANVGKTTLKKRLFKEMVDIKERKSTQGIEVHVGNCLVHPKSGEWIVQEKDVRLETLYQRLGELLGRNQPPSNPDYDIDEEREHEERKHEEKHVSSSLSKGDTLVGRLVKNVKSYVLNRGLFKTKSPSPTAARAPSHPEAQLPSHVSKQSQSLSVEQSVEPLIMPSGNETNDERSYRRNKEMCISDLKVNTK